MKSKLALVLHIAFYTGIYILHCMFFIYLFYFLSAVSKEFFLSNLKYALSISINIYIYILFLIHQTNLKVDLNVCTEKKITHCGLNRRNFKL